MIILQGRKIELEVRNFLGVTYNAGDKLIPVLKNRIAGIEYWQIDFFKNVILAHCENKIIHLWDWELDGLEIRKVFGSWEIVRNKFKKIDNTIPEKDMRPFTIHKMDKNPAKKIKTYGADGEVDWSD